MPDAAKVADYKMMREPLAHPTDGLYAELLSRRTSVAVIGLGYVGLPLALCLAKRFHVVGYDHDVGKIANLCVGKDPVGENRDADVVARLSDGSFCVTDRPEKLSGCRFLVIAVPTPVDENKRPDFSPLISASEMVGRNLGCGALIVYESTVFPGATEEVCVPVVERVSGKKAGVDFAFGYSPERINPGDKEHTVERIVKVVSGMDQVTGSCVADVYGSVIAAGVYLASSIKVAESAKVVENTQRDLNIALMNELALIFHRIGIDTHDVLEAAGTKWNFLPFKPGLVGGHCIGVDPYYLTHKAELAGYQPRLISSARRINEGMGAWIGQECVRYLCRRGVTIRDAKVLVLGITFKEDCRDVRNTKVVDIVSELIRFGCRPMVADPIACPAETCRDYGISLTPCEPLPACDAIVLAVAHRQFRALPISVFAQACPNGIIMDVKSVLDRVACNSMGLELWRL